MARQALRVCQVWLSVISVNTAPLLPSSLEDDQGSVSTVSGPLNATSRKLGAIACPMWCKPTLCKSPACSRCDLCGGTEHAINVPAFTVAARAMDLPATSKSSKFDPTWFTNFNDGQPSPTSKAPSQGLSPRAAPKSAGPVLQGAEFVAHLNQQFAQGSQGSNLHDGMVLSEAGVFLRQFDHLSSWDDDLQPWLPCPLSLWCAKHHYYWPASIVNPGARKLYYSIESGMILNPDVLKLNCLYPEDGNSMDRPDCKGPGDGKTCIPGCYPEGKQCHELNQDWECSYPPNYLAEVMRVRERRNAANHNEIVLDTSSLELPEAILGWFYLPGGDKSTVVKIRDAFLKRYGLDPNSKPLVSLDFKRAKPFRLAGG